MRTGDPVQDLGSAFAKAPADAAAYKAWLSTIAHKVAEAGVEGGFLGFGGEKVSDDERATAVSSITMFFEVGTIVGGVALGAVDPVERIALGLLDGLLGLASGLGDDPVVIGPGLVDRSLALLLGLDLCKRGFFAATARWWRRAGKGRDDAPGLHEIADLSGGGANLRCLQWR